jgi:hypothetical protein
VPLKEEMEGHSNPSCIPTDIARPDGEVSTVRITGKTLRKELNSIDARSYWLGWTRTGMLPLSMDERTTTVYDIWRKAGGLKMVRKAGRRTF